MNDLERSLAFVATDEELEYVKKLPVEKLPRISVVIPSFNQVAFLPETLESVIAQKYPSLEIFVADGGSTDGSVSVLVDYAARYAGLIRYDSRPDGGHFHGVNKGIANTSGEVIAWINSDDVYLPDTFWKVAAFFHFNRGAFVVYGRNRYVDRNLKHVADYPVDWSPLLSEQRRRMMHFCLPPQPSLFFRRMAVILCGGLASRILDYELWLRWQRDLPFYFYDDYMSLSRLHDEAITARANRKLLSGICDTVHRYYMIVPYSWAFRYACTVAHGAAWARGEAPKISRTLQMTARLYWLWLNVRHLPRLVKQMIGNAGRILRQGTRLSS